MKTAERDDLLIRLDERSRNTYHVVEKLEKHQSEQNGLIRDTFGLSTKNATWIRAFKWIIGVGGTALAIWLTRINGLWG